MVFKNEADLKNFLLNKIEDALYITGELVYEKADEKLAEFYAGYSPDYYPRTNQLRDNTLMFNPVESTHNGAEVTVGYTDQEVHYKHGNSALTVSNSMTGEYPHGGWEPAGGKPIFMELLVDLYELGYADYALERGMQSVGLSVKRV